MVKKINSRTFLSAKIVLTLMLFLASFTAFAQTKVTGVVTDDTGEPIVGATVVVKGTTNGIITDVDGRYSLTAGSNDMLVFSYTGMTTVEVEAGNAGDVKLAASAVNLDEVIVTGIGTSSQRKLSSAITQVKTDKIDDLPFSNATAALQGRVAGVVIQNGSNVPGGKPVISIRGGGEPLYVIDGIVRTASDFNSLNSSDIETISILKDAASAAVYGGRAGNGIVVVKTKRGAKTDGMVTYTGTMEFAMPHNMTKKIGLEDYMNSVNKINELDNQPLTFLDADKDLFRGNSGRWLDEAIGKFAPATRHNLTLSGESQSGIRYYAALGYLYQGSIYEKSYNHNDTYKRYNLRSNVSKDFKKIGLEVGINVDGSIEQRRPAAGGSDGIWGTLYQNKPTQPIYNPDGTYTSQSLHPIALLDERSGYNKDDDKYINAQIFAVYKPTFVKGLSFMATANFRYFDKRIKNFNDLAPKYDGNGIENPKGPASLYEEFRNEVSNSVEMGINYSRTFKEAHTFEAQFQYSYQDKRADVTSAGRNGFVDPAYDYLFAGDAETAYNDGSAAEEARVGYVGRLKYDYKGRYIVEGSFRYDGSDNFAPGKKFGLFPSGSVAWVISEEEFFAPAKEKGVVSMLKFRASYGQVGLDRDPDLAEADYVRYPYIQRYKFNSKAWSFDGKYYPGLVEENLASLNNSWFTKDMLNVGVDLFMFDNRLQISADYFWNKTLGYLVSPKDRYTTPLGKDLPQIQSSSEHQRLGVDGSVRWSDVTNGFSYSVGFNFTYSEEAWVRKDDEALSNLMNPYRRITGTKNYYGMAYESEGLYSSLEQILNSPRLSESTSLRPGDIQYKDQNGDGQINSDDEIRQGKPSFPSFMYGMEFSLGYKGFSLDGLFQGTGPRYMDFGMKGGDPEYLIFDYHKDFWTPENTDARFPRPSKVNYANNTKVSNYWLENAAYLRLKSLQLGYDFKFALLKNVPEISMLKLSLAGTNLFTISKVNKYYDPESISNSGFTYPAMQTYSIVLNIGF